MMYRACVCVCDIASQVRSVKLQREPRHERPPLTKGFQNPQRAGTGGRVDNSASVYSPSAAWKTRSSSQTRRAALARRAGTRARAHRRPASEEGGVGCITRHQMKRLFQIRAAEACKTSVPGRSAGRGHEMIPSRRPIKAVALSAAGSKPARSQTQLSGRRERRERSLAAGLRRRSERPRRLARR